MKRRIDLSAGPVTYDVAGEGPPVLFLQPDGSGGSPFHAGLARSFELYAVTLGDVQSAGEFVDRAIGARCDVIGSSSGGITAAWLAATRPDRVGHLVLAPPNRMDDALLARLREVAAPALILRGTADPLVTDEDVQRIRARLRHAYLVYVWDAAHAIESDQPQRMLRLVESFLKRSEAFIVNWESAAVG